MMEEVITELPFTPERLLETVQRSLGKN